MRRWTRFFPIYVAACAWPVVVDAGFGDLPLRTVTGWTVWALAVVAVAACCAGSVQWADRRRAAGRREPWLVVHPVFWSVALVGVSPALTHAVAGRTWPWGSPARMLVAAAGLLFIGALGTVVAELAARRRARCLPRQPSEDELRLSPRS